MTLQIKKTFFAILVLTTAAFMGGCVSNGEPAQLAENQTADYFMMQPTKLEKGHIFMRRSPQEAEKVAQKPEGGEPGAMDAETIRNQELLLMGEAETDNTMTPLPPHKWQDIRRAKVTVHVQNEPFQKMIEDVINRIEPRVGPWRVQWKITRENRDMLDERFSLNTETTFDRFVSSVASFIMNYRGVELNFELFEKERVLVISDVFPT